MKKIIRNRIKCKKCGDIIESKDVHDFVTCKCAGCHVDGGTMFLKRCFIKIPEESFEEMSKFEDENKNDAILENQEVTKLDNLKSMNINNVKKDNKMIENYVNEFLKVENPTRELIVNLIDKIEIYDDKRIDIKFTFNNSIIS